MKRAIYFVEWWVKHGNSDDRLAVLLLSLLVTIITGGAASIIFSTGVPILSVLVFWVFVVLVAAIWTVVAKLRDGYKEYERAQARLMEQLAKDYQ